MKNGNLETSQQWKTALRRFYGPNQPDGRRLRRRPDAPKVGDIQNLHQRAHEILNMHLLGEKNVDIAARLGISEQSVSQIINSRLSQEKLNEMRAAVDGGTIDVLKEVTEMVPEALETYRRILDRDNEHVSLSLRKKTADTVIMDILGHRAPTRVEGRHVSLRATLDSTEVNELKQRGLAYLRQQGALAVLDAEVVDEAAEA